MVTSSLGVRVEPSLQVVGDCGQLATLADANPGASFLPIFQVQAWQKEEGEGGLQTSQTWVKKNVLHNEWNFVSLPKAKTTIVL